MESNNDRENIVALIKEWHPRYKDVAMDEDAINEAIYYIIDTTVDSGIEMLKGFMPDSYKDSPEGKLKLHEYAGAVFENTVNTFVNDPTGKSLDIVLSNEQIFWTFSDEILKEQIVPKWTDEILNIESAEGLNRYLKILNKHEYAASVAGIPTPAFYDFIEKTRKYFKEQIPCLLSDLKPPVPELESSDDLNSFLNDEGESMLPKLKETYSGKKPKVLFSMLHALDQLGLLKQKLNSNSEKVKIAAALKSTFQSRVDHQDASDYLRRFEEPIPEDQRVIDIQKNIIKTFK